MNNWKDIAGYNGKYRVNIMGDIQRIYPSGHKRLLKPYRKQRLNRYFVHLTDDQGQTKEIVVAHLVLKTFRPTSDDSLSVVHKNGLISDNRLINLCYMTKQELGRRTGAISRRKSVAKIDEFGEVVAFYTSAREAGRKNYMSGQTITDYCNRKQKKKTAGDGYRYRWAEELEA